MANGKKKEIGCRDMGNLKDTVSAEEAVEEMGCRMGNFVPRPLAFIKEHNPELAVIIKEMDRVLVEDGALDRKTKRLIALACVAVRMCETCVYPQGRVAANYGATKEEIVEAMHVAMVVGGIPTWSVGMRGLSKLFAELEDEGTEGVATSETQVTGTKGKQSGGHKHGSGHQ